MLGKDKNLVSAVKQALKKLAEERKTILLDAPTSSSILGAYLAIVVTFIIVAFLIGTDKSIAQQKIKRSQISKSASYVQVVKL